MAASVSDVYDEIPETIGRGAILKSRKDKFWLCPSSWPLQCTNIKFSF